MKRITALLACMLLAAAILAAPAGASADGWTGDWTVQAISGETGRSQVLLSGVYTNSYIVNRQNPVKWIPERVVDGMEGTCWQFTSRDGGLGTTYLEMATLSAQAVDEIWFKNGFWGWSSSGGDLYLMNCRLRQVRVEFRYSGQSWYSDAQDIYLTDDWYRSGWQRFSLGRHENVTGVRLWPLSAYTGTDYPYDVCLSEVMLVQNSYSTGLSDPGYGTTPGYTGRTDGLSGNLLMKLATRSGPGTQYDEPGTFFGSNWQTSWVNVVGKAWDGNIWWVLVDFNYGNAKYRIWTGLKRVNVNLDYVPEIQMSGYGVAYPTDAYRGPGGNYAKTKAISSQTSVEIYGCENGYVEVQYYDYSAGKYRRCWVPSGSVYVY